MQRLSQDAFELQQHTHTTMAAFKDLFGDSLLTSEGSTSTETALAGVDAVGIYFSGHWCGPCRGFTPKLVDAYKAYKAKGLKFECVFVSSDRDEEAFKSYFAEQPWLALPFSERATKAKLSKKYKVNGIPSLVIVDGATGETITTDGRSAVMEDPEGANFPWKPPTLWEALGDEVLNSDGESVDVADLRGPGKVLGLYFSASWCPPCHSFTPKLVETFKAVKAAGKKFEIIFVSSDRSMEDFQKYFGTMAGFHAIPHGDKRKGALSKVFEVEGIPTFVTIDAETGATINANARGPVSSDAEGANFPWTPPAVEDLESPEGINEQTSLCVLLDGCSKEVQESALAVLTPYAEAAKVAGAEMLFFSAKSSEGAVPQVRKLTDVNEASDKPQMVLIDIPDDGGFYVAEPAGLTAESLGAFVDAYKQGVLKRKQLGAAAGA